MNSKIRNIFLTFFGVGLSPIAPGTVGTLAAIPIGFLIFSYLGAETLVLCVFAITIIGIKEIDKYEAENNSHDDSKIVIDEVAGVWLTMAMTLNIAPVWLWLGLSFVTFRLFDIWKPSVIGRIDKNVKGGKGVMLDDILAGFFAGLLSLAIYKLISQLL